MRAALATSAASALVLGLPAKRCHNVYVEPNPTDPVRKVALVEAPGTLAREDFAGAIRGMWQADGHASGKVLVAQGTTLSTFDPATNTDGSLTGTIAGTDWGDFAFTESEGLGLFNGQPYVSDGSAIAAASDPAFADLLTDAGVSSFTSVAAIGQRGLLTYGPRFAFTDVLDVGTTTALSYYTAESSPDNLVAGRVVGELYYLFGSQTIEPWAQTGNSDDPFSLQPGMTQQVGCFCRDGIIGADNTLFFIDEAGNPRRLAQGSSPILNPEDPWVTDLFRLAGASNIRGMTYQDRAHVFVGWRTPLGCVVYDVLTQQWHTRGTLNTDTWRWTAVVTAGTRTFVGDADGVFDELSRDYTSEHMANVSTMGTEIVREFTAIAPGLPSRIAINTVRLESAKGVGLSAGQGSDPIIRMRFSIDGGNTWSPWRERPLGVQGRYDQPTIWRRCGRAGRQDMVFQFSKSDPVKEAYLGVVINEDEAA